MHVTVLYNPIAGAGRARRAARDVQAALAAAGHTTERVETSLDPPAAWLDPALRGSDLLVVVGGDGAVRMASTSAVATGTPLYHFPMGTENLVAREFGSDRSIARLLAAIDRGAVRCVDVGTANGRPFLLMASAGFDAEVIHDLAAHRRGRISHLSYVAPIARCLARWRPPRLSVTVDGTRLVENGAGLVVVANSRQYARHLDPAPRASMSDGRLDVVFLAARTRRQLLGWLVRCGRGTHVRSADLVYATGRSVEWSADEPVPYQLDGDPPGPAPRASEPEQEAPALASAKAAEVRIRLQAGALQVLIP